MRIENQFSTIAAPACGVSDACPVQFLPQIVNFVAAAMEMKPSVSNAAKMAIIYVWVRVVLKFSNIEKIDVWYHMNYEIRYHR